MGIGLIKRYGSFTAVDNISFQVKKGEVFGLLGPNGAGKTTTLECLEGHGHQPYNAIIYQKTEIDILDQIGIIY